MANDSGLETSSTKDDDSVCGSKSKSSTSLETGELFRVSTHDGAVGHRGMDPMTLRLIPAGPAGSRFHTFNMEALPETKGRVVKHRVRARCRELSEVVDSRIRLLYRGIELEDDKPISTHVSKDSTGTIEVSYMILMVDRKTGEEPSETVADLFASPQVPCSPQLCAVIERCRSALEAGMEPMLTSSGTGGTYILRDQDGVPLAIFKPKDEEAGTPQNPRGYIGAENTSWLQRPGVRSAHRAVREVAANLMDEGFAGVPSTTLAHGRHSGFMPLSGRDETVWKVGSLQAFVETGTGMTTETSDNFGPCVFPAKNVHKIGIFDLRIVNFDRNYGNILVQTQREASGARSFKLIPIDHGCCLPDRLQLAKDDLVWMSWPQAKLPFTAADLEYIASLDGAADARRLSSTLGMERNCLRLLEVSTKWLQVGAAHGLSLYDIGLALCRESWSSDDGSAVEKAIKTAICTSCAAAHVNKGDGASLASLGRASTVDAKLPSSMASAPASRAGSGIFELQKGEDGDLLEWTPLLEDFFRRHIAELLMRLACAASRSKGKGVELKPTLENAVAASPSKAAAATDQSLTLPKPSSRAWVPPSVRRRLAAGSRMPPASDQQREV